MSEIGLIVIWANYENETDKIKKQLLEKFQILEEYKIEWSQNKIYQNFYRLYGDRLSTSSIKEKNSNQSTFTLIVFQDNNPKHDFRLNARGFEKVNTNFFDTKKQFRNMLGTKFGIHGTNSEEETNKDLTLILGENLTDYKKRTNKKIWDNRIISLKRDITGSDNWDSLEDFFYCINAVEPYVILRNANTIFDLPENEDIDFLVKDPQKFALFTNAVKLSNGIQRANYAITIANKRIKADFRYIGDGYFDIFWQRDCFLNRQLNENNIFVMDNENQYYNLAYHALIHKRHFPSKYLSYFGMNIEDIRKKLFLFMDAKNYSIVEPKDITLFFNRENGGDIKFSRERRLRNKKGFIGILKRFLYKLNNFLHNRKGAF